MAKSTQLADIKKAMTRRATAERRLTQSVAVFSLKINKKRCNKEQLKSLKMMLVESKWSTNFIISKSHLDDDFDIMHFDAKELNSEITHYDKDHNPIESKLEYLPISCRQTLIQRMQSNVKTLST